MDPALQRRVQRYGWDLAATDYERYWSRQLGPAREQLLELAALRAGERVVDVACGTGLVTLPAARAVGPGGHVAANDISERMVEYARVEAGQAGIHHIEIERMDAESLAYPDGGFDAALCAFGLMYAPDPDRALAEIFRVLRPGGRAVAAVWGARNRCGWAEIFPIVERRVQSEVCPLFFMLGTKETLARAFESAGFVNPRTERIATTLHYDSPADAIGAAFVGGPVALAYSRFDQPTREETHREYLASIAAFGDGARFEIPGEFVIVRGEKPGR